jgi:8-oxo-dGTP pyrophosphatase MutT (NUDIX family)
MALNIYTHTTGVYMTYEKKLIFRAGTIPYIVENGQVLMMFMKPSNPEYGGDTFQIAKGRVEDGEDIKTAALREAKEELGLFIGNVTLIEELGLFMGRTTVYVAKVKDRNMFGEPSFEAESVTWMTEQQFLDVGRVLHRPVVSAAMRKIKLIEGLR